MERFVLAFIPSVGHLEALLLLRAHRDEEISLEAIAAALFIGASSAAQVLAHLVARGLVATPSSAGPFRYAPGPDLEPTVDQLAEAYRTRLIPLSRFIHEHATSQSIRDFADAFRLRKKE